MYASKDCLTLRSHAIVNNYLFAGHFDPKVFANAMKRHISGHNYMSLYCIINHVRMYTQIQYVCKCYTDKKVYKVSKKGLPTSKYK